jgi:hypothetical protein
MTTYIAETAAAAKHVEELLDSLVKHAVRLTNARI